MHRRGVSDEVDASVWDAGWPMADRLEVTRFDDPARFEEAAGGFLLGREAEHNLILGLLAELRSPDSRYPEHYLATVTDGDRVVACALRTPPFQVALSHVEDAAAVDALVDDLYDADPGLWGVLADRVSAERFVSLWRERTQATATRLMEQRIHAATKVTHPDGVPGVQRDAAEGDRGLMKMWMAAFEQESGVAGPPADADERVTNWLTLPQRGVVFWMDEGRPVSMAGFTGPTPNGIRIGAVYTPPELRGRGYATANVAALTQRLLEEGRRFCFLYTDLANPISNAIYARIGYEPVCDVEQYRFT